QERQLELADCFSALSRIRLPRLLPIQVVDRIVLPMAVVAAAETRIALAEDLVRQGPAQPERVDQQLEFAFALQREERAGVANVDAGVQSDRLELGCDID